MSHSEAFINGWKAHDECDDTLSPPCNPYNPETQKYSFSQWYAGLRARSDYVQMGSSIYHPDSKLENL